MGVNRVGDPIEFDHGILGTLQNDVNLRVVAVIVLTGLAADFGQVDSTRKFVAVAQSTPGNPTRTWNRGQAGQIDDGGGGGHASDIPFQSQAPDHTSTQRGGCHAGTFGGAGVSIKVAGSSLYRSQRIRHAHSPGNAKHPELWLPLPSHQSLATARKSPRTLIRSRPYVDTVSDSQFTIPRLVADGSGKCEGPRDKGVDNGCHRLVMSGEESATS
ncbi:hypothetical protein K227x_06960 [Rubripirellula lacrimiformis]|uniref:Uncharacterized protein n=1 Tax=Rubripirellula lacrimiformis TaxID=1930273 RepID=A0A517N598_9BACT|nr:hypothetical protein K227x_06960 [Rubripirellula lacrimiformis]